MTFLRSSELFKTGKGLRGSAEQLRLHEAAVALSTGSGSREDWELFFGYLAEQSEYYYVAAPEVPPEALNRREGKRELFARILYLLDVPVATLSEWRAAALAELGITSAEGER